MAHWWLIDNARVTIGVTSRWSDARRVSMRLMQRDWCRKTDASPIKSASRLVYLFSVLASKMLVGLFNNNADHRFSLSETGSTNNNLIVRLFSYEFITHFSLIQCCNPIYFVRLSEDLNGRAIVFVHVTYFGIISSDYSHAVVSEGASHLVASMGDIQIESSKFKSHYLIASKADLNRCEDIWWFHPFHPEWTRRRQDSSARFRVW